MLRRVAGPRHALLGVEHARPSAAAPGAPAHELDRVRGGAGSRPAPVRIVDRGRQADAAQVAARACASRARPSASRSPRLLVARACISSRITHCRLGEELRALPRRRSSASCFGRGQQDVAAARSRWRWRRICGVSPVRLSARTGSPISAIGVSRLRLDVDGQRLEGRDVERVQLALALRAQVLAGGGARRARSGCGRKPARVLPPPVGAISSASCPAAPARSWRAGAAAASSRGFRTSVKTGREAPCPSHCFRAHPLVFGTGLAPSAALIGV